MILSRKVVPRKKCRNKLKLSDLLKQRSKCKCSSEQVKGLSRESRKVRIAVFELSRQRAHGEEKDE